MSSILFASVAWFLAVTPLNFLWIKPSLTFPGRELLGRHRFHAFECHRTLLDRCHQTSCHMRSLDQFLHTTASPWLSLPGRPESPHQRTGRVLERKQAACHNGRHVHGRCPLLTPPRSRHTCVVVGTILLALECVLALTEQPSENRLRGGVHSAWPARPAPMRSTEMVDRPQTERHPLWQVQ